MRSRILPSILLFTSVFLGQKAVGQITLQTITPESQNISTERLNRIGAQVNQWIKEGQLNGARQDKTIDLPGIEIKLRVIALSYE